MLGTYIFINVKSPPWFDPLIIMQFSSSPLVTVFVLSILSYFVWQKYCYPGFIFISICMGYPFPFPHFLSVWIFRFGVSSMHYLFGSWLCICSATLRLFIGSISPFTFKAIILCRYWLPFCSLFGVVFVDHFSLSSSFVLLWVDNYL